ncbi:hypothetical protein BDA96_03G388000 [Sorghum bicolor]|uniref:Secreted protein n=1 Tax=Sorghum bicolor TaxID=4558 RepID=A0A921RJD7_SORBI|nr:hypothetical protein BDA96_03G388000 [Sorghum bicolor]
MVPSLILFLSIICRLLGNLAMSAVPSACVAEGVTPMVAELGRGTTPRRRPSRGRPGSAPRDGGTWPGSICVQRWRGRHARAARGCLSAMVASDGTSAHVMGKLV